MGKSLGWYVMCVKWIMMMSKFCHESDAAAAQPTEWTELSWVELCLNELARIAKWVDHLHKNVYGN